MVVSQGPRLGDTSTGELLLQKRLSQLPLPPLPCNGVSCSVSSVVSPKCLFCGCPSWSPPPPSESPPHRLPHSGLPPQPPGVPASLFLHSLTSVTLVCVCVKQKQTFHRPYLLSPCDALCYFCFILSVSESTSDPATLQPVVTGLPTLSLP